jgi:endonuclease/exonuclease/phosphatase family metal-dependent hydrolase
LAVLLLLGLLRGSSPDTHAAPSFSVATYNLENYLDAPAGTRPAKPPAARAKIREALLALRPDVLAVQEMGSTNALLELRASLKSDGLDLPHWELVRGYDTNIHVAVLSRFPISARRPHVREGYLLQGRRLHVSRGFAEVDIQVSPAYSFTLFAVHLKSKRQVAVADEAEMRLEEARLLREILDARLRANPATNLVVVGDMNDTVDSPAMRRILGRGRTALVDTRPAERNGDDAPNPNPRYPPRRVLWTYYYGVEDSYTRIDYILLSPGMVREWDAQGTYVLTLPNWGVGSDHRPIRAGFRAEDK